MVLARHTIDGFLAAQAVGVVFVAAAGIAVAAECFQLTAIPSHGIAAIAQRIADGIVGDGGAVGVAHRGFLEVAEQFVDGWIIWGRTLFDI